MTRGYSGSEALVMKLKQQTANEHHLIPSKLGLLWTHIRILVSCDALILFSSLKTYLTEQARSDLPPIPASELPFKCHLCEGSFGERSDALDHIRIQHPSEFQLLMSKGALETTSEEDRIQHDEHDEVEHSRGRFPDYAHRKVSIKKLARGRNGKDNTGCKKAFSI